VQLVRDNRINVFPHWTPDGNRLVYYSSEKEGAGVEYRSVAISGGAPETILQAGQATSDSYDVGRDGRLLYQRTDGQVQTFDPRDSKTLTLGVLPDGWGVRWSPDGTSVAYMAGPRRKDDPDAGIWVTDFKTAPRQVFRGWVTAYALDAKGGIYAIKGKADLNGELWKVNWDGSGLTRIPRTIPLPYNNNYYHSAADIQFDISPDGRRLVFQTQQVLQENIGIIDNLN
jgi:Tol biopolymer transport system component